MRSLIRLLRILSVGLRLRAAGGPRGKRLREALERLGPIAVKFGQVLSTRRDLVPLDVADELARLQDRVPPFPPPLARAEIERSLGRPIEAVFSSFDENPVASASISWSPMPTCTTPTRSLIAVYRAHVARRRSSRAWPA